MTPDRTILVGCLIEAAEYAVEVLGEYAVMADDEDGRPSPNRAILARADLTLALMALQKYDTEQSNLGAVQ